ncbi:unnamed protein product, partial [marine sediment metagenome]
MDISPFFAMAHHLESTGGGPLTWFEGLFETNCFLEAKIH